MTDSQQDAREPAQDEAGLPDEGRREAAAQARGQVTTGTLAVLMVIVSSMVWYLLADRYTPYTRQARVQGFVIGVAPKVSGLVTDVWVRTNQEVVAGQPLFQIDRSQYAIALQRAESELANMRSQVDASDSAVATARANLRVAEAGLVKARQDAERQERLYREDSGAISVRRLEIARASLAESKARVAAAASEVQRAIDQKGGDDEDNARLKSALSAVDKARLDLDNTLVAAASDGLITDLRADVGQYAGAGNPVMTLIAIHDVWIDAEFTENNLGHMRPGGAVEIVLDALPGEVFAGRVRSIGLGVSVGQSNPAGTLPQVQNNRDWLRQAQRFRVAIDFDPGEIPRLRHQLRIGGQAEVIVYAGSSALLQTLGRGYIRLMSWLSYAY
jgi:multidrug resistance efflux pump